MWSRDRRKPSLVGLILLMVGSSALPALTSSIKAQTYTPPKGQHVRVTAPRVFPRLITGTVRTASDSLLTMGVDSTGRVVSVRYNEVECLERKSSYDPVAGRVLGATVGSLGWLAAMVVSDHLDDGTNGPNLGYMWVPAAGLVGWHVGSFLRVGSAWMPTPPLPKSPRWSCGYGWS